MQHVIHQATTRLGCVPAHGSFGAGEPSEKPSGSSVVMHRQTDGHTAAERLQLLCCCDGDDLSGPDERPTWTVCKACVHAIGVLAEPIVCEAHALGHCAVCVRAQEADTPESGVKCEEEWR